MQNDDHILKILDTMSENMKIFLSMIQNLEKRIILIENEVDAMHAVKSKISPVIFRHNRFLNEQDEVEAKGGVTYAFQIDYTKRIADVGISVCSKNENFNKKTGREIAEIRLRKDPISFHYEPLRSGPLVIAFWNYINDGRGNSMSDNNKKLVKKLLKSFKYFSLD